MSQIYHFIYRARLRLKKLTVSRIHEWSNGLIIDLVLGAKRQNCVINEAGNVHGSRADHG